MINVPFYTIENNELKYLDRYKICNLSEETKDYILKNEGVIVFPIEKKNYNNKVLVLEPHCDDFALSALAYTLYNSNVKVLNIFSKTSIEYFTWNHLFKITQEEYEKLRLDESKFAIEEVLKEEFISLKETSTRITNKTKEEIEKIILNKVLEELKKDKIDTIMVPMGVGNHPDHIIVYDSIMNNKELFKDYRIILYPEFPYSRNRKDYFERLNIVEKNNKLNSISIDVDNKLETMADIISIYRSQFDDINRNQMLAIIREDARALSFVYYEVK